ncbi:MAG: tetratricopeptide repeat protein [Anaerolineae bacterium]|nr:tetratricopeptide repeat protein [Anaerolineae bacterium]
MKRDLIVLILVVSFVLSACGKDPRSFAVTISQITTDTPQPDPQNGTPSAVPVPPIPPLTRIQSAEKAFFYGDYETARAEFESAFRDGDNSQIRAAALWGLGRTEYADRRYAPALTALQQIITEHPNSAFIPYTNFLLGETNYELGRYQEAEANYSAYLDMRPGVLDAYVHAIRGNALSEAGNFPEALRAYEASLAAPRLGKTLNVEIKIAEMRTEIGDYASAIATYESISAKSDNDYVKAQMDYLIGQAHQEVDQTELAFEKYRHAVENYPLSYFSYLALVELVSAEVPVSDLDRGLVDYFAGAYDVALAAFDRHIKAGFDTDGTALYYRALTLQELQNYTEAIQAFSKFIAEFPSHFRWAEAWGDKAYTQWFYMGDTLNGAQTYLDFVDTAPTAPIAVDYLMIAARILERMGRLEEAAQAWQRVADEYPDRPEISQAIFLAGITHYRRGDYHQALSTFQRSLLLSPENEDRARAYLWIGKTNLQLEDPEATQVAWQQAQEIDPAGYYSERARELLIGRAPFEISPTYNLDIDWESERAVAAGWVRLTFGLSSDTELEGLGPLAGDIRIVRGTEYWELGLYNRARLEFEDLRKSVSDSPENSFRLANYLLDLGLYRSAIFAARQVLSLAGLDDYASSLKAPPYFNHVRYGTYYADLIVENAEAQGLHPLFIFSVMRLESLFEGFVRSNAGARGLMQIIPETGADIAKSIGWPVDFDPEDLYRPNVSVRLGTQYLASNLKRLDGDMYAALAAYNAGPGRASVWKELAGDDQDLLLETIRFQETRDYIRFIYEIFSIYRSLYSPVK